MNPSEFQLYKTIILSFYFFFLAGNSPVGWDHCVADYHGGNELCDQGKLLGYNFSSIYVRKSHHSTVIF